MVYSVIPVMVNVFPLLVCPYAKILAGMHIYHSTLINFGKQRKKGEENGLKLTINTTDNGHNNFLGSFLVHLPRRAIGTKYSV